MGTNDGVGVPVVIDAAAQRARGIGAGVAGVGRFD